MNENNTTEIQCFIIIGTIHFWLDTFIITQV